MLYHWLLLYWRCLRENLLAHIWKDSRSQVLEKVERMAARISTANRCRLESICWRLEPKRWRHWLLHPKKLQRWCCGLLPSDKLLEKGTRRLLDSKSLQLLYKVCC